MKKRYVFLSFILLITSFFALSGCSFENTSTSYKIEAELSGSTLVGKETLNYYNNTESVLTELKFNLYANAFREGAKYSPISAQYLSRAYPNGLSYGDIKINSVMSNKKPLEYLITGEDLNVLTVSLGAELFPEERVQIEIEYNLNLANVVARTGWNEHTINLANFYPVLCAYDANGFYECLYYANGDPFYSECADYEVIFTCDMQFEVASSGKLVSKTDSGEKSVRTFKIENARSFAMVLSKEFESVVDIETGVEITYYFYDDSQPAKSIEYAKKSLKLFTEKFGEYPYPTYSVVQTEFIQGGMEFPALVMISDNLEQNAYGEVIVHETAHQWWMSAVGNNEVEHAFLDEGLAEYSVVLFYENYPEYNLSRKQLIESSEKTYKVFCSVYDKIVGKTNTVMLRPLGEFSSEYEYVNMAYIKPCIMFDYLRQSVGDKGFFEALKRYYEHYKFKNATPDDLIASFVKTGKDTESFFYSFFDGKVII